MTPSPLPLSSAHAHQGWVTLLGIDPGLRETGWGVIVVDDQAGVEKFHAAGSISTTTQEDLGSRLHQIFRTLLDVIDTYHPSMVAVEEVFVNRNPVATMKLCHGRAAALLAVAHRGIPVREFHNRAIKSAIVGKGNAQKQQMLAMIQFLLPGINTKNAHAIDALCVAVCAQQRRQLEARTLAQGGGS
ncbi:MAG: crossover junction endodeoxyribonuclease RuvC [Alphaproteobacteria bacterium]|nr:crossover junction endodeoxyribonuclease RuvC [Alphaproteobacteria bacterium]